MDTNELLKKVRQLEIKTRVLSNNVFAGEYHSAFKGRGMSFSEVREYQVGDDVRDIDWNVTARFGRPHTKLFEEERELTAMLLVDMSNSLSYGAYNGVGRDIIAEIAATLAFSAIQNNDKIGVIFYSDRIEKYIPPKKGRKHILYILRELLELQPEGRGTDLGNALEFLINTQKKACSVFILSDFVGGGNYSKPLAVAARKHEVAAIQVYDRFMAELPNVGMIKVADSESDEDLYVDSSSRRVRQAHAKWWQTHQHQLAEQLSTHKIDLVSLTTEDDYVSALKQLFENRG